MRDALSSSVRFAAAGALFAAGSVLSAQAVVQSRGDPAVLGTVGDDVGKYADPRPDQEARGLH